MNIAGKWLEHGQYSLKILQTDAIVAVNWVTCAGSIRTSLDEKGILKGFTCFGGTGPTVIVDNQILFDGACPHEGFFRSSMESTIIKQANQQPTTMPMPELDVPTNTEVEIRARLAAGGLTAMFFGLYMIAYQVKVWEAAPPAVCFPTDAAGMQAV